MEPLEAWSLLRVQSEEAENLHRPLSSNRHLPTDPAHRFTAAVDEGIYVKTTFGANSSNSSVAKQRASAVPPLQTAQEPFVFLALGILGFVSAMPILRAFAFLQRSCKYSPKKDEESVDLATPRSTCK